MFTLSDIVDALGSLAATVFTEGETLEMADRFVSGMVT